MIEGEKVRLRPWIDRDIAAMTLIRNDVPLQAQLLAKVRGSDATQVRHWLVQRSSSVDSLLLVIADTKSDGAIGFFQLTGLDSTDHRADLGICLARPWQGKGLGSEVLSLAMPHVRNTCDLRKFSLRVRADNAGAIRCYAKAGFKECGRLRKHMFLEGVWHDIVLMEYFFPAEK